MTLQEWADVTGRNDREIARLLGQRMGEDVSYQAVQTYRTHARIPTRARMQAIYAVTEGWVSANDFYEIADVSA